MSKMEAVLAKEQRIRELEAMPLASPPPLSPSEQSARDIRVIKRIVIGLVFVFIGIPMLSWFVVGIWIAAHLPK